MGTDRGASVPCLLDGVVVEDGRVTVGADGGLVTAGEGLFETILVIEGRPVFLAAHLDRLADACRALEFGQPPPAAVIVREIAAIVAATGLHSCSLRITLFRDGSVARRLVVALPLPVDAGLPVVLGFAAPRFDGARSLAAWKTLNTLQGRLAHQEGAARGCDEVLFTLADGTVLEGTRSSVFLVDGDAVVTPPLSLPILPSVTRAVIVAAARRAGRRVCEEAFKVADLRGAREAFISASVRGVRAVRSVEGRALPVVEGEATSAIRGLYRQAVLADVAPNPHDSTKPVGS
jgi:branched-subunit amino acid aminotransferase/4-amino-4-deoxychorismate lyase